MDWERLARGPGTGEGVRDDRVEGEIEVGVDPVPFTRVEEHAYAYAHDERKRRGIQTGRVSARPGTAEVPSPVVDVLAQTHAVLTPALADAIWPVAEAPVVERLVDEHSADFYLMYSGA